MWYYKDGDTERGPINKDELRQLLKDRKIDGKTLLRSVKGEQWRPLAEMARKKPQKQASSLSPPPATSAVEQAEKPGGTSTSSRPPAVTKLKKMPFQFTGYGGEYFKIWIVNIVLSVLTLGIYSAWAKVRRKQYFYGNTRVNDASFNYLADPVNILKGRFIVFIGFILYSLVDYLNPVGSMVLVLFLVPVLPWMVVRALSFNARNSATRNIRFAFYGTYLEAAKVFLFWPLLLPLTLGCIFPYLLYRQKKFVVDNTAYGTARFNFGASAKQYYQIFLGLLLPLIICVALSVIVLFVTMKGGVNFLSPFSSMLFLMVFYLYAMAYIAVKSTNLLFNSSKLSEHGFASTMAVTEYLGIVITNTLATVLTLGFFYPFALVRAYRYRIEHLALMPAGDLDQFVAAEQEQVSALGDEAAEFFDFDIGI